MSTSTGKWSKAYWEDLGERAGSTLVYGLITFFTLDGTTSINSEKLWPVVFLPTVLSALKSLLVNLSGGADSASLVGVKSKSKRGA